MPIDLKSYIRNVPDFPKKGIVFKDISPLLKDYFESLLDQMTALFNPEEWEQVEYLVGIEARGFIVASALAARLNKGFIPIRKQGKLPPEFAQVSYDLEYGSDTLEMHHGSGKIILVDDVLATGGTLEGAAKLCEQTGHDIMGMMAIIDLKYLNNFKWQGKSVRSIINY